MHETSGVNSNLNGHPWNRPIRSVPGLAAAFRLIHRWHPPVSSAARLLARPLVEAYQVPAGAEEREIRIAGQVIAAAADRLRRLAHAYAEWEVFDPCAYFDLYPEQADLLVHVSERVTTVHVTFYADLLLPSFRRVEQTWAEEFFPAYQAAYPFERRVDRRSAYTAHYYEFDMPKILAYWDRLQRVVKAVRSQLVEDIGFLAAAGGSEERAYWQHHWPPEPAQALDPRLLLPLDQIETLTLTVEFPLPAHRQPGRYRRLRRLWQRRFGRGQ